MLDSPTNAAKQGRRQVLSRRGAQGRVRAQAMRRFSTSLAAPRLAPAPAKGSKSESNWRRDAATRLCNSALAHNSKKPRDVAAAEDLFDRVRSSEYLGSTNCMGPRRSDGAANPFARGSDRAAAGPRAPRGASRPGGGIIPTTDGARFVRCAPLRGAFPSTPFP
jgi:hypothetical protein